MENRIYLDYQATTPTDSRVLEVMMPWLSSPANPHAIEHRWGQEALDAVENARHQVASLLNGDPKGILFTSNATEAANIIIRNFAEPQKRMLISAIEHPCVSETALECEKNGVEIETIPVGTDGIVELEGFPNLSDDCSLISVMTVNNEIGTIQPIRDIALLCQSSGVPFHTDATQAVGRIEFDMSMGVSFASLSSHKIYGPAGIGAICASSEMLHSLKPLVTGGGQQEGIRSGTLSTALCVGFGEACRIAEQELKKDYVAAMELSQAFLHELDRQQIDYHINGSMEQRIPHNLNICFNSVQADELIAHVPNLGISTGSACSSGAIKPSGVLAAIGLSGDSIQSSIRIGFGRNLNIEDAINSANQIAAAVANLSC